MGVTKSELFNETQNEMAILAKAIGHPARIAILQHVISSKSCINSDLVSELGLAQATVSQHLKELKQAGLLKGSVEGTSMCYCLNTENWNKGRKLILELFDFDHKNGINECC